MKTSTKVGITAAILAAGLFGASKLDRGNIGSIVNHIPTSIRNGVHNIANKAVYDGYDPDKKYILVDYIIGANDRVKSLVHGKQYLIELVGDINNIQDFAKLRPGDKIKLPVESEEGKTFLELYDDLYRSRSNQQ
ncbi:hypothetical protein HYT53_04340 [Candidatus Woesearchaeota archaeon]|nr:hypothetical protein [Candidatus Woesearchaeota archaeon]